MARSVSSELIGALRHRSAAIARLCSFCPRRSARRPPHYHSAGLYRDSSTACHPWARPAPFPASRARRRRCAWRSAKTCSPRENQLVALRAGAKQLPVSEARPCRVRRSRCPSPSRVARSSVGIVVCGSRPARPERKPADRDRRQQLDQSERGCERMEANRTSGELPERPVMSLALRGVWP
jgi:hypothetical protein